MHFIVLRCAGCAARIKAPADLRGRVRSCPGCGHRFVVQSQRVEDAGVALVPHPSSGSLPTTTGR